MLLVKHRTGLEGSRRSTLTLPDNRDMKVPKLPALVSFAFTPQEIYVVIISVKK